MSQNNDWLAYEKSGSCRNALCHASFKNTLENAYEKITSATKQTTFDIALNADKKIYDKKLEIVKRLEKYGILLVNAYRNNSKESFLDNLSKYSIALNDWNKMSNDGVHLGMNTRPLQEEMRKSKEYSKKYYNLDNLNSELLIKYDHVRLSDSSLDKAKRKFGLIK